MNENRDTNVAVATMMTTIEERGITIVVLKSTVTEILPLVDESIVVTNSAVVVVVVTRVERSGDIVVIEIMTGIVVAYLIVVIMKVIDKN